MPDQNSTVSSFRELIRQYIDDIGEQEKQAEYLQYLQAYELYHHLLNVNLESIDDQKEFNKRFNKIQKLKPLLRYLTQLEQHYQHFKTKKWIVDIDERLNQIKAKSNFYNIWINKMILTVDYVTPATHVAKLTHSSCGGSSLIDTITEIKDGYLTTSCLDRVIYDGAYPNAGLSKTAKFLILSHGEKVLGLEILAGNSGVLADFAESEAELSQWISELQKRLQPQRRTDALAKQVYFPINDQQYHLLVPLKSSSLIQAIHDKHFSKDIRQTRGKVYKLVEKGKFSEEIYRTFPQSMALATVMSQPQNVSVLNGSRAGNIRLFSSSPPNWQQQIKALLYKRSLFEDGELNSLCSEDINKLRSLLLLFQQLDISFKHPARFKGVVSCCNAIVNRIFDYAQQFFILTPGWSADENCCLYLSHRYFLDPYRDDAEFQQNLKQGDWRKELEQDFAAWLNRRLAGKKGELESKQDYGAIWRTVFEEQLRNYMESLTGIHYTYKIASSE